MVGAATARREGAGGQPAKTQQEGGGAGGNGGGDSGNDSWSSEIRVASWLMPETTVPATAPASVGIDDAHDANNVLMAVGGGKRGGEQ